jgi:hypothetical protein
MATQESTPLRYGMLRDATRAPVGLPRHAFGRGSVAGQRRALAPSALFVPAPPGQTPGRCATDRMR